jgi:hypothetical protein
MNGNAICTPAALTNLSASLSNNAIWRSLLNELTPYNRTRLEGQFASQGFPPFFTFVIEAVDRDAASGRISHATSPLMDSVVPSAILNPAILSSADAIRLAKAATKLDDRLDAKLLSRLTDQQRKQLEEIPEGEIARALEIIDEISDCRRLVMPLAKFLKLPQRHLRSKVVKLIARASQNPGWADTLLADADPRVRSNFIDGISLQSGPQIDMLLRRAATDPHHRVATTALLELYRRGDQASLEEIRKMETGGSPAHRCAAEWALRQIAGKAT